TRSGGIWLLRSAALALALGCARGRSRPARAWTLGLALVVALTTSLTGHAADRGDLSASAAIDWVHVVAGGAWAGGLMWLALISRRATREWPMAALGAGIGRVSRLARWCLLLVVSSGAHNAWGPLAALSAPSA